ncbi:MAG: DUF3027 domain-containing protein [Geodermatophilaceae bacterium]|nr:DUF3027 domain-containing protein [Geodermatophilaceae bacterium]
MREDDEVDATVTEQRPVLAPDPVLAGAVELARRAAVEDSSPAQVGAHRGCVGLAQQDPSVAVAVHSFDCTAPAYTGWCWSVSVARLYDDPRITVDEVVLQPGDGALLPPPWVPWSERLQPGDLGVGDLLPTAPDDERLVPAYGASGDSALDEIAYELGLGRVRVMSRLGRTDAAERWNDGSTGPDDPMARQAPGPCGSCGFYLPLEGSLRAMLGVCGNEYSPSDGRAVAVGYGCGAHSEAANEPDLEPLTAVSYDTQDYDVLEPLDPDRLPET